MKRDQSEPMMETCNGQPGTDAVEWASAQPHASAAPVTKRILIVGAGETGRQLARQLERHTGYHVVGFIEDDPEMASSVSGVLGGHDDVLRVVDEHGVDEVVVAYAPSWQQRVAESLVNGHSRLSVKVVPTLYETMIAKPEFQTVSDVPLIDLHAPTGLSYASRMAKRGFDIAISMMVLLLTLPLTLLVILGIRFTSVGPAFIAQERVGRNGRLFRCLKFRTMVSNAEESTGPVLSSGKADARVTPFGRWLRKTRVDEIPQFFNVLLGHMSVVGPRPERTIFVNAFRKQVMGYDERHKVRPGITGLAQVHGYYLTDVHTKLRYDMLYVYNQSLLLDIKILIQTLREMLTGSGS